jgi:hypothetical protein
MTQLCLARTLQATLTVAVEEYPQGFYQYKVMHYDAEWAVHASELFNRMGNQAIQLS